MTVTSETAIASMTQQTPSIRGLNSLPHPARAAWLSVGVMLLLAIFHHEAAGWLCAAAALVGLVAWRTQRRLGADVAEAEPPPIPPVAVDDSARQLLDAVFEALADPVLIISGGYADDISGRRVVLANAAARDLMRVARDGGPLVASIRDPDLLEAVDEALFGGLSRTVDYVAGGSQTRQWRASIRPLPPLGASPLALLSLRDETDLRRTEKMRVDFLANASHELKTPLASLTGFIETLKGHARDDATARDRFLDIMAVQADRMGRLIADLMSLSRIELNEHVPPQGSADLSRAVRDVVDAVGVLAATKGVALKVDGDRSVMIDGERDEIIQVAQNLVDNAVKYAPKDSTVEITIRPSLPLDSTSGPRPDGVTRLSLVTPNRDTVVTYGVLSVRDHGPGMQREHLPRLTERFYRVEGQKSGARSGTGLGLAIVKHIVNRHRGGLAVESAPGDGAAFIAYFPMVSTLKTPEARASAEASAL